MIPGKTGRGVEPYREVTHDKRLCEERETHSHPIHQQDESESIAVKGNKGERIE